MSGGLGEMRGSFAEVCRSLGKECGGLGDVCGSLGEVVCCEVYNNLAKEMKTIQWAMCAEVWERWFIAKFILTLKIFALKTPKTMWEEILSL